MSKLKPDNILFEEEDYLVEVGSLSKKAKNEPRKAINEAAKKDDNEAELFTLKEEELLRKEALILSKAQTQSTETLNKARFDANKIIEDAKSEASMIIETAKKEADSLKDEAKKETDEKLTQAKEEIEAFRIEEAKRGYEEGHKDGLIKIKEELDEKISSFDEFCKSQFEIKEKMLKSLSNDVLAIINSISKKVLLKELDSKTLEKIIKATISKLEKKENITIILSEKYAKLLFELQTEQLENDETELNFEDFKQYENFQIVYNPKFAPDTIIVENLNERLDASISSQLDILIREIYENISEGNEENASGRLDFEDVIGNETD